MATSPRAFPTDAASTFNGGLDDARALAEAIAASMADTPSSLNKAEDVEDGGARFDLEAPKSLQSKLVHHENADAKPAARQSHHQSSVPNSGGRENGTSSSSLPSSVESEEESAPPWVLKLSIGKVVNVKRIKKPGWNYEGGAARITCIHDDGTFDVKYVLGGSGHKRISFDLFEPKDYVNVNDKRAPVQRYRYDAATGKGQLPTHDYKELMARRNALDMISEIKRLQQMRKSLDGEGIGEEEEEEEEEAAESENDIFSDDDDESLFQMAVRKRMRGEKRKKRIEVNSSLENAQGGDADSSSSDSDMENNLSLAQMKSQKQKLKKLGRNAGALSAEKQDKGKRPIRESSSDDDDHISLAEMIPSETQVNPKFISELDQDRRSSNPPHSRQNSSSPHFLIGQGENERVLSPSLGRRKTPGENVESSLASSSSSSSQKHSNKKRRKNPNTSRSKPRIESSSHFDFELDEDDSNFLNGFSEDENADSVVAPTVRNETIKKLRSFDSKMLVVSIDKRIEFTHKIMTSHTKKYTKLKTRVVYENNLSSAVTRKIEKNMKKLKGEVQYKGIDATRFAIRLYEAKTKHPDDAKILRWDGNLEAITREVKGLHENYTWLTKMLLDKVQMSSKTHRQSRCVDDDSLISEAIGKVKSKSRQKRQAMVSRKTSKSKTKAKEKTSEPSNSKRKVMDSIEEKSQPDPKKTRRLSSSKLQWSGDQEKTPFSNEGSHGGLTEKSSQDSQRISSGAMQLLEAQKRPCVRVEGGVFDPLAFPLVDMDNMPSIDLIETFIIKMEKYLKSFCGADICKIGGTVGEEITTLPNFKFVVHGGKSRLDRWKRCHQEYEEKVATAIEAVTSISRLARPLKFASSRICDSDMRKLDERCNSAINRLQSFANWLVIAMKCLDETPQIHNDSSKRKPNVSTKYKCEGQELWETAGIGKSHSDREDAQAVKSKRRYVIRLHRKNENTSRDFKPLENSLSSKKSAQVALSKERQQYVAKYLATSSSRTTMKSKDKSLTGHGHSTSINLQDHADTDDDISSKTVGDYCRSEGKTSHQWRIMPPLSLVSQRLPSFFSIMKISNETNQIRAWKGKRSFFGLLMKPISEATAGLWLTTDMLPGLESILKNVTNNSQSDSLETTLEKVQDSIICARSIAYAICHCIHSENSQEQRRAEATACIFVERFSSILASTRAILYTNLVKSKNKRSLELASTLRLSFYAYALQVQSKFKDNVPLLISLAHEAMRELVAIMIWLPNAYSNTISDKEGLQYPALQLWRVLGDTLGLRSSDNKTIKAKFWKVFASSIMKFLAPNDNLNPSLTFHARECLWESILWASISQNMSIESSQNEKTFPNSCQHQDQGCWSIVKDTLLMQCKMISAEGASAGRNANDLYPALQELQTYLVRYLQLSHLWDIPAITSLKGADDSLTVSIWKKIFLNFWNRPSLCALHNHLHPSMLCSCPDDACGEKSEIGENNSYPHHCDAIFPRIGNCHNVFACCAHFSPFVVHSLSHDHDYLDSQKELLVQPQPGDSISSLISKIVLVQIRRIQKNAQRLDRELKWFQASLQKNIPRVPSCISVTERVYSQDQSASSHDKNVNSTISVLTHRALRGALELILYMAHTSETVFGVRKCARMLFRILDTGSTVDIPRSNISDIHGSLSIPENKSSDPEAIGLLFRAACILINRDIHVVNKLIDNGNKATVNMDFFQGHLLPITFNVCTGILSSCRNLRKLEDNEMQQEEYALLQSSAVRSNNLLRLIVSCMARIAVISAKTRIQQSYMPLICRVTQILLQYLHEMCYRGYENLIDARVAQGVIHMVSTLGRECIQIESKVEDQQISVVLPASSTTIDVSASKNDPSSPDKLFKDLSDEDFDDDMLNAAVDQAEAARSRKANAERALKSLSECFLPLMPMKGNKNVFAQSTFVSPLPILARMARIGILGSRKALVAFIRMYFAAFSIACGDVISDIESHAGFEALKDRIALVDQSIRAVWRDAPPQYTEKVDFPKCVKQAFPPIISQTPNFVSPWATCVAGFTSLDCKALSLLFATSLAPVVVDDASVIYLLRQWFRSLVDTALTNGELNQISNGFSNAFSLQDEHVDNRMAPDCVRDNVSPSNCIRYAFCQFANDVAGQKGDGKLCHPSFTTRLEHFNQFIECLSSALNAAKSSSGAHADRASYRTLVAAFGSVLYSGMLSIARQLNAFLDGKVEVYDADDRQFTQSAWKAKADFIFSVLKAFLNICPQPLLYEQSRITEGSCALIPILKGILGLDGMNVKQSILNQDIPEYKSKRNDQSFAGDHQLKDHAILDSVSHAFIAQEIDEHTGEILQTVHGILKDLGAASDTFLKDQLKKVELAVTRAQQG